MRVFECSYEHTRAETRATFSRLSLGPRGMMRRVIDGLHNRNGETPRKDARVVYVEEHGTILGWAILVDPAMYYVGSCTEAYFFVMPDQRRRGISTELMRAAHKA